jgi:alcohol oxidase
MADDEFNVASQFLAVAAEYDKERGLIEDTNDFHTCNGYGVSSSLLSSKSPV